MTGILPNICSHPLFGITMTLMAYVLANTVWRRTGMPALLHPVLVSTIVVAALLILTGTAYADYFAQTTMLNEGLGVVIVLLAVPFYRQLPLINKARRPIIAALLLGSVAALASALAFPVLSGVSDTTIATLAPKSVTAAVAMEISERLGGVTSLTAVVVISTGIFGAVFGPALLRSVRIEDDRAIGFAIGLASHAIGTARAFQISAVAGAFASLGMILNALLTIALAPVIFEMLVR